MLTAELLFLFVLLLANGAFALAEIAVVSARKSRLEQRSNHGDTAARRALELANDPNRFLATVQIGITLVGVFAGAFGGATIAQYLSAFFAEVPVLAPYAGVLGLVIVVVTITYLTLVIGELVPKRIALTRPERIASLVAGPMHMLSRVATPLVRLLGASTNLVLRALRVREPDEPVVTEADVTQLLEKGTRAGVFHATEQDIVENVFWLGDQRVDSIMTPRPRIAWLDANASAVSHIRTMIDDPQARYIVCDGELDRVIGVVSMKELWPATLAGQPLDVRAASTPPLFVPETTRALSVLEQFRTSRVHVALVVDEYGRVEGLVTLTDILEGLVGEIAELAEADVVRRDDGSWLVSGSAPIEEVYDLLGVPRLRNGERTEYRTLAGFMLSHLGRVPAPAEHFEWQGYRFEVVDMDGKRIDKVLVAAVR